MDNIESKELGRKPNKFNIVDALLLIIIVAAVGVLAYIFLGNTLIKGSQNTTIEYKIEIEIIKNDMLPEIKKLQEGAEIFDSVRNQPIGKIKSVEIEDAYKNVSNTVTGVITRVPQPEHSRIIMTVQSKCEKTDMKYYIGGKNIMVGVKIDFRTYYFINSGFCTDLEEVKDS